MPLDLEKESQRILTVAGEGTIIISKMIADDAGNYTCSAYNGNGTAVDTHINLRMTRKF